MAKPTQHQDKADDNRAFLDSISATGPPDWMATVAFYAAVHLVEKLRAYRGEHSKNHEERGSAVRKHFRPIQTAYHELFNYSIVARYYTRGKFTLTAPQVKSILIDGYLATIERYVSAESAKQTGAGGGPSTVGGSSSS